MGDKGGGGLIISNAPAVRPKSLLEALAEIEQYSVAEQEGSEIPKEYFTIQNKIEFWEVGFKGAFVSGLVSAMLMPFAISVVEKTIPVFGDEVLTVFDQVWVFVLALSFSLGYAVLIAQAGKYYKGTITKQMVHNLYHGMVIGGALKALIAFILFHTFYFAVVTPKNVAWLLLLGKGMLSGDFIAKAYAWILQFRESFLTSAWMVLFTTCLFIAIPVGAAVRTWRRGRHRNNN